MFKYIVLVIRMVCIAYSANILGITPTPSYSHQLAFYDFWSQLSLRGHNVTVITTDPQKNEELTNLTEIDISWAHKYFADISNFAEGSLNMWNFHKWVHDMSSNISEELLSHQQFHDLIYDRDRQFDVILMEWFHVELLGIREVHNCPVILISSLDVFIVTHEKIGNPTSPILYPDEASCFYPPLGFIERVLSVIYYLHTTFFYNYVSYPEREQRLHRYFNTTSTIKELIDSVDMIFVNANPAVQTPRAVGPTTIYTGSLRHKLAKPLPTDIQEFLDNATMGFIYFSLGTNIKRKDLNPQSIKAVTEVLKEMPYKVLWKFEADPQHTLDQLDNVKLLKWAPQLGILAHPNIKLFVTQGGLQSMEEAIFYEVPCVVIPFLVDQYQNAKLMRNKGFAEIVDRHPYIAKNKLKNIILKVINNLKYKKSVVTLKRLSLDTPMTGLESAIWWTEYVIRNKGAKHLRNPAADLPLYQYYFFDVVCLFIFVVILTLKICVKSVKLVKFHLLRGKLINKKLQ